MRNRFKEYRNNLRIALPVALSQLGHIAVGVADSVMVGRLGGLELAAATVAFSVFIPFMMLGIGVSYGISPLVAKAEGERNTEEISSLLKHGIILCLFVGMLLTLFLFFSAPILWKLNQPPRVVELAIPFFRIMALSIYDTAYDLSVLPSVCRRAFGNKRSYLYQYFRKYSEHNSELSDDLRKTGISCIGY